MVPAGFQEIIQFNALIAAFRRSPFVIHEMPFVAVPRWRSIETNVGRHGNGAGSAELSGRARGRAGTDAVVIQRAAELGVLTLKIIAVGFHLQAGLTDRNTIGSDRDAMVIRGFSGVAQVEVNVRGNTFALA